MTAAKPKKAKTQKSATPKPRKESIGSKILVNVILDRSGSMDHIQEKTIDGYNEYINGLRADKKTEYNVSLTQFDAPGHIVGPELTVSYIDKPLAEVPKLDKTTYVPRGSTPLYDAIGETIRRTEPIVDGRPVLCIIITDGMENASKEFTRETIKKLTTQKESEGWTFVFLGANIDAPAVAHGIGGQSMTANSANYAPQNMMRAFQETAEATRGYAQNRQHTNSATMDFAGGEQFFTQAQKNSLTDTTGSLGQGPGSHTFNPGSGTGKKAPWTVVEEEKK